MHADNRHNHRQLGQTSGMSRAKQAAGKGVSYADAGVDISAGNALVEAIKPLARSTRRKGADSALGGFGGLFDLKAGHGEIRELTPTPPSVNVAAPKIGQCHALRRQQYLRQNPAG